MKFRIKNCPECAYWSSPERLEPTEFCVLHEDKEDQPPGIIKAIKEVKKERWEERVFNWLFFAAFFTLATSSFINLFSEQKKSSIIFGSVAFIFGIIFLSLIIYVIVKEEKETKKELKELQKKKSEWIIDYGK